METNRNKLKVLIIWIAFCALTCLGAHIGPDGHDYLKSLNEPQTATENLNLSPHRIGIDFPKQPKSLKDYLHDIANESLHIIQPSDGEGHNGKVVVVAWFRKDNKTNEGEWKVVAEPKNNDFSDELTENQSPGKYFEFDIEDIKKIDDNDNILFSFKDLITISTNPSMKEKIDKTKSSWADTEDNFNVTYIMPIPNKKEKYFRIVVPNLTQLQYEEINTLLNEHKQKKFNKTERGVEGSTSLNFNIKDNKKHLSSRSLTDSSLRLADLKDSKSEAKFAGNLNDALNLFKPVLEENGYNKLLDSWVQDLPKSATDKTESTEPRATLITRENGLRIPVATDYKQDNFQYNDMKLEHTQRSITSQRNQRPQTNQFNYIRNRSRMITTPPTTQVHTKTLNAEHKNNTSNISEITGISNEFISNNFNTNKIESTKLNYKQPEDISQLQGNPSEKNFTSLQMSKTKKIPEELSELSKEYENGDRESLPVNILQAANFILDMKKKLEEEDRKRDERHKAYIKSYLQGDNSIFPMKSVNGSVMKITKQEDNILEELKLLMLDYFTFLNFNLFDSVGKNSSLAIESILNATDLFELMERSSKLVKINLQIKMQNETREPTGFVKRIVETQVGKCRELTTKLRLKVNQSNEPITRKTHKTYMVFTRCMNLRMAKCVRGFSTWLQRGKFFLRPQFTLSRAYQNYEIEKNLYCLRSQNAPTSESNARGIKIRPGLKVNSKYGMRRKMRGGARAIHAKRRIMKNGKTGINEPSEQVNIQTKSNRSLSEDGQTATRQSVELDGEHSSQSNSSEIST